MKNRLLTCTSSGEYEYLNRKNWPSLGKLLKIVLLDRAQAIIDLS